MQSILDLPGKDDVELLLRDQSVGINISPPDQFGNLLIRHILSQLISHSPQVLGRNEASLLIVEQGEYLVNIGSGVLISHTLSHETQPLSEVNSATAIGIEVSQHLEDGTVLGLESEGSHGSLELYHKWGKYP